jgi:DNA replication initiation complex subunit (GINS family)
MLASAILAGAPGPARAQAGAAAPPHKTMAERRAETVEQRIADLHAALKITPAEEPAWEAVAQTMRDNAAAMRKLAEGTAARARQGMTAVEDMQSYEQFARAHADQTKSLLASFTTLYNAMPEEQKKLADQVFRDARRHGGRETG